MVAKAELEDAIAGVDGQGEGQVGEIFLVLRVQAPGCHEAVNVKIKARDVHILDVERDATRWLLDLKEDAFLAFDDTSVQKLGEQLD